MCGMWDGFIKTQHTIYQDLNISELSRETAINYLNDIYPRLGDYYVSFLFGTLSDRSINVSFAPQNLEDGIRA